MMDCNLEAILNNIETSSKLKLIITAHYTFPSYFSYALCNSVTYSISIWHVYLLFTPISLINIMLQDLWKISKLQGLIRSRIFHVTHYMLHITLLSYVITINLYLWAKWVISHYNNFEKSKPAPLSRVASHSKPHYLQWQIKN